MKSRSSLLSILLAWAFLLTACGPSAEQAATMTASAWTPTPLPTATLTPTLTPSPTPTNTPFVPRITLKIVSNSPASTDIARAAELAVSQLSMPLQEMGIKIEFAAYDDQHDIDIAAANAREIAADPLVMCGVGHYASRVSIPASDIYHAAGLAFISPSSTSPTLTDRRYPEINRVVGRDDEQGAAGARFAHSQGFQTIFIVRTGFDYERLMLDSFRREAKALGLTLVGELETNEQKGNFEAAAAKLLESQPDMVYFSGIANQAGLFFKIAREAGYLGTFLGTDGMESPLLVENGGPLLTSGGGVYFTATAAPASFYAEGRTFVEDFQARFGAPPQLFAAEAYDAAGVCLKAIEEAARAKGGEAPTRQEVAQAVRALRDYKGITGVLTFNAKGDLQLATYYVYQIVSVDPGKWEQNPIITTIQAAPPE